MLEKNNELIHAKNNTEKYDSALALDLKQFNNSQEFRDYIKKHDVSVDRAEAIFIGWLFVFIAEIANLLVALIIFCKIKIMNISKTR